MWERPQDLIELALRRGLLPSLGVLQCEDSSSVIDEVTV
jgi:hypothetical protein